LERISFNVGRRTHAGPCGLGIDTLRGREFRLSSGDMDMAVSDNGLSSSASQSVPIGLFDRETVCSFCIVEVFDDLLVTITLRMLSRRSVILT